MEQLIAKLEEKTNWLSLQLKAAKEEIALLKKTHEQTTHSASMDLLSNMNHHSTEDQLQLYISDSLDLLDNTQKSKPTNKTRPAEQQLNFDLFHEHAETSNTPTSTSTKQIDPMTSKQTEQTEQTNEPVVESHSTNTTNLNLTEDSNAPAEAKKLTPEQKARLKNQKNNRRLIKMLEDRYPKAFDWNKPKPLKVGIDKDMTLDEEFNASKQKRALAAYTRSDRYKKCLLTGQPRINLEGVAVSDEPALPESMMPTKTPPAKRKTTHRPKKDNSTQAVRSKQKPTNINKPNRNKKPAIQEDDAYANLSPEERMKAKLEKLFNKS